MQNDLPVAREAGAAVPAEARPGLVCAVFFVSGAAALLFEHVWFRKAGLLFGNGVWASSIVLSSFMAGLALGNALAARLAGRVRRPLLAYAAAETAVGGAGVLLVLVLPALPALLAPVLRPYLDSPFVLNSLRLGLAFALIGLVTTAMGTTLPLLAHALTRSQIQLGTMLGRLYGWNTLGATAGALAGEAWLYDAVGVRATGFLAGGLSLLAAALAVVLARGAPSFHPSAQPAGAPPQRLRLESQRLLLAAASCGAIVLALEVVWWRFLQLFVSGSGRAFAVVLSVILFGIGAGGLLAGAILRRRPDAYRWSPALAFTAGFVVLAGYTTFGDVYHALLRSGALTSDWSGAVLLGGFLALPLAVISGVLFTFIATAVGCGGVSPARATALATLANTLGAMTGAVVGGFLLLPSLGMERSFALLGVAYGVVALVLPGGTRRRPATLAAGAAFLFFALLFPFGLMARSYLPIPLARHMTPGGTLVAFREGLTETVALVAERRGTAVLEHRLVTNDYNMSATGFVGRRYMKLFAYLPVALHPAPRHALLISYGVGSTARALADTRELERIDVVDISREILESSSVVFPNPATNPLLDPRVRVHVEDGRYFLQTTQELFDLITAEPPPPKMAGVVNLYSREYFDLVRGRLAPGGFATYWLPIHSLEPDDARSIMGAFCAAFEDCTLWKGMGLSWMLVGTRKAQGPCVSCADEHPGEPHSLPESAVLEGGTEGSHDGARVVGFERVNRQPVGGEAAGSEPTPDEIEVLTGVEVHDPSHLGGRRLGGNQVEKLLGRLKEVATVLHVHANARVEQRVCRRIGEYNRGRLEDFPRDVDDVDALELASVCKGPGGRAHAIADQEGMPWCGMESHWQVGEKLHVPAAHEAGRRHVVVVRDQSMLENRRPSSLRNEGDSFGQPLAEGYESASRCHVTGQRDGQIRARHQTEGEEHREEQERGTSRECGRPAPRAAREDEGHHAVRHTQKCEGSLHPEARQQKEAADHSSGHGPEGIGEGGQSRRAGGRDAAATHRGCDEGEQDSRDHSQRQREEASEEHSATPVAGQGPTAQQRVVHVSEGRIARQNHEACGEGQRR